MAAALAAERGGADGITVHLREDRRHIQDADVDALLSAVVRTKVNLEMAVTAEMVAIACRAASGRRLPRARAPRGADDRRRARRRRAAESGGGRAVRRLRDAGIRVSLFIDPDARRSTRLRRCGAHAIEIHTGALRRCQAATRAPRASWIAHALAASQRAHAAGLIVNAGHGLTLDNVAPIAALAGRSRAQHRPQHRRPRALRRHRSGDARDEGAHARRASGQGPGQADRGHARFGGSGSSALTSAP